MRYHVSLAILVLVPAFTLPVWALSSGDKDFDQQDFAAIEARIGQAPPRNQCFLYAELIHQMTETSLRQYTVGDAPKANALLRQVQSLLHKVHLTMAIKDNRLKNAEILLRRTAFRLTEMLHSSDLQERPLLADTLAQVKQADNAAMMQVFKK